MVDDMKKQMRRFEHLIGFKGRLDVTSRESMKRLIDALGSRYKSDIQNSIRLHRLEFFHDLVEGRRKRKEKMDQKAESPVKKRKRKKSDDEEEEDQQEEISTEPTKTDQTEDQEVLSVRATDVDDWKDLMTLSKIYYVLEHPRSEGLKWKRRIAKKKNVRKFSDKDFIEWRVTQNFRLRGLEEWAQRKSDARKLAEQLHFDMDEIEADDDVKELEQLYEMFDPSGRKYKGTERTEKSKKALPTADRPFKFKDEGIEDWTESYSDDSDYSDDYFVEETDDFKEESERKMAESVEEKELTLEEAEDISQLFSRYPEFIRYREEIFKRMEKAETTEEWFKLYFESCPTPEEMEISRKKDPLITVIEEEEEEPEPEAESESEIKETDLVKEDLQRDKTDIVMDKQEPQLESVVKNLIQTLVEETSESREKSKAEIGTAEKEMDPELKPIVESRIPITEETSEPSEFRMSAAEEKESESKFVSGEDSPEEITSGQSEKSKTEMGIVEEELDGLVKSVSEEGISVSKDGIGEKREELDSQTDIVEEEQETEQLETLKGINEKEKKTEKEIIVKKTIQTPEETAEIKEQGEVEIEDPLESMPKEEAHEFSESTQHINPETDGEEPDIEAASKEKASYSLKEEKLEAPKVVENKEASDNLKTDDNSKGLRQPQKIEHTSDEKEKFYTSAMEELNEEPGMQKSLNEENKIPERDEEPKTGMHKLEKEQLTPEDGKQDDKCDKPGNVKKGESKEIKECSSKTHRRRSSIKKSVSYSLLPMTKSKENELSFAVRRSDSQESVLLCSDCSKVISDIPSQDTDEDDVFSIEMNSKTEEDAEEKKDTESE